MNESTRKKLEVEINNWRYELHAANSKLQGAWLGVIPLLVLPAVLLVDANGARAPILIYAAVVGPIWMLHILRVFRSKSVAKSTEEQLRNKASISGFDAVESEYPPWGVKLLTKPPGGRNGTCSKNF